MREKFWGVIFDKRAITPVLSNLLLTVVAVAAMSIATTATYVITTNLRGTMSERLVIEDLWFAPSNGVGIYLRNIGKIAIRVSAVYANHTSWPLSESLTLGIGEHGWLNISQNWSSDSLYYINVVTDRGTHVGGYYEQP